MRLVLEGLKKLELTAIAGETLSETGQNRRELRFLPFPTFNIPLMTTLAEPNRKQQAQKSERAVCSVLDSVSQDRTTINGFTTER